MIMGGWTIVDPQPDRKTVLAQVTTVTAKITPVLNIFILLSLN
jgi:hypothetical protein